MKAQLSLLAVATLFLHSSWMPPAILQQSSSELSVKKTSTPIPGFGFFRTHRQGPGIMTTWGLTTNSGVSGFIVEKTYEDPSDPYSSWETIGSMPCGAGRSFKKHDLNVSPGFISYRVIGYLQGGGTIVSPISTEHIVSH